MNPVGAHIGKRCNRMSESLTLQHQVVLDDIRRTVCAAVADALRLVKGLAGNLGKRYSSGRRGIQNEGGRRRDGVSQSISPSLYFFVKDSKPGAHGRLVIRERVPGNSNSRIEIHPIRILSKHMRPAAKAGVRKRIHNSFEWSPTADAVGCKVPPKPEIHRQFWSYLPIVLNSKERSRPGGSLVTSCNPTPAERIQNRSPLRRERN